MMLAFFSKTFYDAHFHLRQCETLNQFKNGEFAYCGCSCAHETEEFEAQEKSALDIMSVSPEKKFILAFGIHPQLPLVQNADFMEKLLEEGRIGAVGEAGFDLFTDEYKSDIKRQEEAWNIQLELSAKYAKPLVVHCRKAMDRMFRDSKSLKKLPAVVFHSFAGSVMEAKSLINRGVNAYFSFGKQLLNGDKSAASCVKELSENRILLETDAPYQTLKGEDYTSYTDIARVYEAALALRGIIASSDVQNVFTEKIKANFTAVYGDF